MFIHFFSFLFSRFYLFIKPVYYISKSLLPIKTRYSYLKKVIIVLVTDTRKLIPYFEAHIVHVLTNLPIRWVLFQSTIIGCMMMWVPELENFDIKFIPQVAIKGQFLADFMTEFAPLKMRKESLSSGFWRLIGLLITKDWVLDSFWNPQKALFTRKKFTKDSLP